jgi:hypothetical protein
MVEKDEISIGTHHIILSKVLEMHCVYQYCILRVLTQKQHSSQMRINGEFISIADNIPNFLQKNITGNKIHTVLPMQSHTK